MSNKRTITSVKNNLYSYGNVIANFVFDMKANGVDREEASYWLKSLNEEDREDFLNGAFGEGEKNE